MSPNIREGAIKGLKRINQDVTRSVGNKHHYWARFNSKYGEPIVSSSLLVSGAGILIGAIFLLFDKDNRR